jgi:hypothetical protein
MLPIGPYIEQPFSETALRERLLDIRFLPDLLERTVQSLDEYQLELSYREGGWSIRQIIHHLADSHLNAYIRCKLTMTENNPTVKPYDQDLWADLNDNDQPVNLSITLLHALHRRWHGWMMTFSEENWMKTFYHPEYQQTTTLWYTLGKYAWHGKHHVAQIEAAISEGNFSD